MAQSREELEMKLAALEEIALDADPKAAAKQHAEGKLTARERIDKLLDPGTFVEEFMLAETQCVDFGMAEKKLPSDGVVTGFGKVEGRPVYVYSQDRAVLAGSVGSAHAEKIAYVIQTARKLGVPVIGLNDSAGARIQEGLSVTSAIGKIFFENSITSGCIPQISAIMGPCIGVGSYSPALTDFILQVQNTSQMFITGPAVIKEVLGETVTMEELGGAKIHSEVSGVTDLVAGNDEECLAMIRRLLGFLPSNFEQPPPRKNTDDDPARALDALEKIVPQDMKRAYNILQVIKAIVDDGEFFELKAKFARNLVIGFGRLDGCPAGFVANQPMFLAGSLDVDASDKAARFIRFCDAFNIPVITLMDVPGFFPGKQQEEKGIIRHGAKMLYAYAEATVPKITIVLRKGYGGAKQALCTREMGADQLLVWPGVELAVMGGGGAVNVLYRREIEQSPDPAKTRAEKLAEYQERFNGPLEALSKQFAHAAIRPRETRRRLIQSLEILRNKKEERPRKKHGLMPV
ncbi:MAG: acyl-CoA carboxylase subunit beta [Deltaproteobacteria bacterium]|nr:acyl-CoA carboxylase subunit beta [Deltaproteobacteria bacterium]MDZ4345411.1 acyl-CoA carboxylase subunit beta [Candidatus Binatia bacterium]